MHRRIVVAGNCQTGGIAAALQFLFPEDEIAPILFNPRVIKGGKSAAIDQLASADLVFGSKLVKSELETAGRMPRQFVTGPGIYFSAFHPDIVSAQAPQAGKRFPYNSMICVWAYKRGIDPADAMRLYTRRTFAALGYFHRWASSVAIMKSSFNSIGLDFDRFYLSIKRDGAFMHTNNHPKIATLIRLAKMLAIQAGAAPSVWHKDFHVNDALARVETWPVYPEVAHELALPGSYSWSVDRGRVIEGLRAYVEYAYDKYAAAGVGPADIQMMGVNASNFEDVLTAALQIQ